VLKKAQAEYDTFPTEIYHDRIARILEEWREELRASPQETTALERAMSGNFVATSPAASLQSQGKKADGILQEWEAKFQAAPLIGREAFAGEWRSAVRGFSKLLTVEFQITGIHADTISLASPDKRVEVRTRVRYEFVGERHGFHREQWIGNLELDWEIGPGKEIRLRKWRNLEETRSRSLAPVFEDIAAAAFAECASYGAQFLPGVDTW
jgi:hypothetical protein